MRSRIHRLPPFLRWWGAAVVAVLGLAALLSAVASPGAGILLVGATAVSATGWWTGTACRRRRVRARLERLAKDAIRGGGQGHPGLREVAGPDRAGGVRPGLAGRPGATGHGPPGFVHHNPWGRQGKIRGSRVPAVLGKGGEYGGRRAAPDPARAP